VIRKSAERTVPILSLPFRGPFAVGHFYIVAMDPSERDRWFHGDREIGFREMPDREQITLEPACGRRTTKALAWEPEG